MVLYPCAGLTTQMSGGLGIADGLAQVTGQFLGRTHGAQVSGFFVNDEIPAAGRIGGDDGQCCGHRLQDGVGQSFRSRAEKEDVGGCQDFRHVAALAEQYDPVREFMLAYKRLDGRAIRPLPYHDESDRRLVCDEADGGQHFFESFDRIEPTGPDDQGLVCGDADGLSVDRLRLGKTFDIDCAPHAMEARPRYVSFAMKMFEY